MKLKSWKIGIEQADGTELFVEVKTSLDCTEKGLAFEKAARKIYNKACAELALTFNKFRVVEKPIIVEA